MGAAIYSLLVVKLSIRIFFLSRIVWGRLRMYLKLLWYISNSNSSRVNNNNLRLYWLNSRRKRKLLRKIRLKFSLVRAVKI